MGQTKATPALPARHLAVRAFRAIYARDPAVREAQAVGLWFAFFLVWAPLMVIGEPLYQFLVLRAGLQPIYAMLISLAVYMLPARWIAGRISVALLERQRQRVARREASASGEFWKPFLVAAAIACIIGALFAYLWLRTAPIALAVSAGFFLSGLPFKPWQTPLRQAVAAGILVGTTLPGLTIGMWMIVH